MKDAFRLLLITVFVFVLFALAAANANKDAHKTAVQRCESNCAGRDAHGMVDAKLRCICFTIQELP